MDAKESLVEHLKAHVPNLKTEAQFDMALAAFELLQVIVSKSCDPLEALAYQEGINGPPVANLRGRLQKLLETLGKTNEMAEKIQEIPPEERSKTQKAYVSPPFTFLESDVAAELVAALSKMSTEEDIKQWYAANKAVIDSLKVNARNKVFDAIRARNIELKSKTV